MGDWPASLQAAVLRIMGGNRFSLNGHLRRLLRDCQGHRYKLPVLAALPQRPGQVMEVSYSVGTKFCTRVRWAAVLLQMRDTSTLTCMCRVRSLPDGRPLNAVYMYMYGASCFPASSCLFLSQRIEPDDRSPVLSKKLPRLLTAHTAEDICNLGHSIDMGTLLTSPRSHHLAYCPSYTDKHDEALDSRMPRCRG